MWQGDKRRDIVGGSDNLMLFALPGKSKRLNDIAGIFLSRVLKFIFPLTEYNRQDRRETQSPCFWKIISTHSSLGDSLRPLRLVFQQPVRGAAIPATVSSCQSPRVSQTRNQWPASLDMGIVMILQSENRFVSLLARENATSENCENSCYLLRNSSIPRLMRLARELRENG